MDLKFFWFLNSTREGCHHHSDAPKTTTISPAKLTGNKQNQLHAMICATNMGRTKSYILIKAGKTGYDEPRRYMLIILTSFHIKSTERIPDIEGCKKRNFNA